LKASFACMNDVTFYFTFRLATSDLRKYYDHAKAEDEPDEELLVGSDGEEDLQRVQPHPQVNKRVRNALYL